VIDTITLGNYTFATNPHKISPVIDKRKISALVDTYDSVATFDFGSRIEGLEVTFQWDYLEAEQYDELQTLLETAGDLELNFGGSNYATYDVHLMGLTGSYFMNILDTSQELRRQDVTLTMVITGEQA